jgi:hypothetical protein
MNWLPRHTLAAGLAIIALTNAVALGGAAWNRSGEPDSTLDLTERELRPPYVWRSGVENSGLALRLQWRVLHAEDGNNVAYSFSSSYNRSPAWLDASKMSALGFGASPPIRSPDVDWNTPYYRQLPRDVLVVLELDGPAYREALDLATKVAKELEKKNENGTGKQAGSELMIRETLRSSRLFAVDAGLDRAALRSKFPDRTRYAIVHGQIRPAWNANGTAGRIENLSALEVNVPLAMRGAFEGVASDEGNMPSTANKRINARLAFGRRLEPWLVSATRSGNDDK